MVNQSINQSINQSHTSPDAKTKQPSIAPIKATFYQLIQFKIDPEDIAKAQNRWLTQHINNARFTAVQFSHALNLFERNIISGLISMSGLNDARNNSISLLFKANKAKNRGHIKRAAPLCSTAHQDQAESFYNAPPYDITQTLHQCISLGLSIFLKSCLGTYPNFERVTKCNRWGKCAKPSRPWSTAEQY